MQPPTQKPQQPTSKFQQTNSFAMYHGLFTGLWCIATLLCYLVGLKNETFALLHLLMMLAIPIVIYKQTIRFRGQVALNERFSFFRATIHAALVYIYAAFWAAAFFYLYFAYFDKGYVYQSYLDLCSSPEVQQMLRNSNLGEELKQIFGGQSLMDVIKTFQILSPSAAATYILYIHLTLAIYISPIVAILTMRHNKR